MRVAPPHDPIAAIFGSAQIMELVRGIEALKKQFESELGTLMEKAHAELTRAQAIQKGLKGDPGTAPALAAIVAATMPKVQALIPEAAKVPTAEEIVAEIMPLVIARLPKQKKGTEINVEALKQELMAGMPKFGGLPEAQPDFETELDKLLKKGKVKAEHVAGVETAMQSYLRRYGYRPYIHGSGGGGLSKLTATGTIDAANKTFTFTSAPIAVVVNGATYFDGGGVTITGTTAVLDNPAGVGGAVAGLG